MVFAKLLVRGWMVHFRVGSGLIYAARLELVNSSIAIIYIQKQLLHFGEIGAPATSNKLVMQGQRCV